MVVGENRISCPVVLLGLTLSLTVAGCTPDATRIRVRLQSVDPAERIGAIQDAVKTDDPSLLPLMVKRLADDDAAVRMYAIIALEKLTGTRLNYSYRAPRHIREARIAEWRRYIQSGDDYHSAGSSKSEESDGPTVGDDSDSGGRSGGG